MLPAPVPANERARLDELLSLDILDTDTEPAYDDIVALAAELLDAPIALVSLVDHDRQWFKAVLGLGVRETHRDLAFCGHAILEPGVTMVVEDARNDPRFEKNALVTGDPNIRFYAGTPLVTPSGQALGTLCVIDREPRQLKPVQLLALEALGRQVVTQLELRKKVVELEAAAGLRRHHEQQLARYQERLERSLMELEQQNRTDVLTGALNRRAMNEALHTEVARWVRHDGQLSVAMIDIDEFKLCNDLHGHQEGDVALVAVADAIRGQIRDTDTFARYGGEEFCVILPGTGAVGAGELLERVRKAVERVELETGWQARVSAGVAEAGADRAGVDELLRASDDALYEAKRLGRNRVVVATPPTPKTSLGVPAGPVAPAGT